MENPKVSQQSDGMDIDEIPVDERSISREKEKARQLRRTQWWMGKLQRGVCHYCLRRVGRLELTMDHVVPLSRGGKSKKGNVVPACKACNNMKKYRLPIEWDEYLASLGSEKSGEKSGEE
jgi:5-methylcytosine-specific restriction enzyme A